MQRMNRQWRLRQRPTGMVADSDFTFGEEPVPPLSEGQVLVRTLYLSCDPTQRGWLREQPTYMPPVALGAVMRSGGTGQVVESRSPRFQPGEYVSGLLGWQDYAVIGDDAQMGLRQVAADELTLGLGVLGLTGVTAYFGLLDVGRPRAGETVVVSGAAGATGSAAAQIARVHGCRAIGIAGGPDKCAWLRDAALLDGVIDYKAEDVGQRLRELCPKGVDVYFDNVGGPLLELVIGRLALRGRIVLCGGISVYNEAEPPPGPRNLMNLVVQRGRMEGFVVSDYAARWPEAQSALRQWLREDRLRHQEDIVSGLENAPAALRRLFEGKNRGKQLVQVAAP